MSKGEKIVKNFFNTLDGVGHYTGIYIIDSILWFLNAMLIMCIVFWLLFSICVSTFMFPVGVALIFTGSDPSMVTDSFSWGGLLVWLFWVVPGTIYWCYRIPENYKEGLERYKRRHGRI